MIRTKFTMLMNRRQWIIWWISRYLKATRKTKAISRFNSIGFTPKSKTPNTFPWRCQKKSAFLSLSIETRSSLSKIWITKRTFFVATPWWGRLSPSEILRKILKSTKWSAWMQRVHTKDFLCVFASVFLRVYTPCPSSNLSTKKRSTFCSTKSEETTLTLKFSGDLCCPLTTHTCWHHLPSRWNGSKRWWHRRTRFWRKKKFRRALTFACPNTFKETKRPWQIGNKTSCNALSSKTLTT